MNDIFILQNQANLFLGKQKDWLDGRDLGSLFKTLHKDEAINQMVEVSSKDYTQRIKILTCQANDKGLPIIAEELLPPPLPKAPKPSKRDAVDELDDTAEPEEELMFTTTEESAPEDSQENLL